MDNISYDIAISFAGENRDIALALAKRLDASGYSVFYDEYEIDRLWGSDLTIELGKIYGESARFCLMIVSEHYVRKMWTNHERQYAIARLMERGGEYVLPLKVDDSAIPGLPPSIAYLSLQNRTIDEVFQLLLRKLGAPAGSGDQTEHANSGDTEKARRILEACYRRAVFTKMDSEIRLDAMFQSLSLCLQSVQPIVPTILDQSLQHLALQVVRCLDELERTGHRYRGWSIQLPPVERHRIDMLKLRLVDTLLELRRQAGVAMTLPTSLEFDHFYSVDDANAPPRYR